MPKKSAVARNKVQRNRPRVQKSIELVRQTIEENKTLVEKEAEADTAGSDEVTTTSTATVVALDSPDKNGRAKNAVSTASRKKAVPQFITSASPSEETNNVTTSTAPTATVASRLAARRQGGQKGQHRGAAPLIVSEHYAYVRRELLIIAIIAIVMFAVLIILHFVPAIGG